MSFAGVAAKPRLRHAHTDLPGLDGNRPTEINGKHLLVVDGDTSIRSHVGQRTNKKRAPVRTLWKLVVRLSNNHREALRHNGFRNCGRQDAPKYAPSASR
ncbi:hypothetical protein [Rhodanobacter thiooxydans]|uniref:hypothetical protein n=1 Tax=Rhodanobacter thiooxydans TaxID=416169 RepID=UPI00138A305E|nr:hypothetical protein [Rhodanobacter thiooxydans]MCW0202847.1 hypothetical protein [Rhodanobacter thiooxydans]